MARGDLKKASPQRVMRAIFTWIAVACLLTIGCVPSDSAVGSNGRLAGTDERAATSDPEKGMEDFIGMTAAFIQRAAQDVKAAGFRVIFTDVGPESLERDAPDLFRELIKRSSGGGVQVRGFSRAEETNTSYRDKQTAEKGVGLWMLDYEEDAQGKRIVSGWWAEKPRQEDPHKVKYLIFKEGVKWKAQNYLPSPKPSIAGKPLLPGVTLSPGPEGLSGQLIFQKRDFRTEDRKWTCVSNTVFSIDLKTQTIVRIANLGDLDARLVKVSDDGRLLCFSNGSLYVNARFFVHSIESGQTKEVKFPGPIQELGIAVLSNSVFVASYGSGPLYRFDFLTGLVSEFRPAGLPVNGRNSKYLPILSYPRTRFSEPGVLYFTYGTLAYYRWTEATGELTELLDFSYCMTSDGNHVRMGERQGNSYPLMLSATSSLPSIRLLESRQNSAAVSNGKLAQTHLIANFKYPGGRSCHLDQLSPSDAYALLRVEAGVIDNLASKSTDYYIVSLADGRTQMLLRNEYSKLHQGIGSVGQVFWVKKDQ